MDANLYKQFQSKPDEELFAYVTERESSQNRHVAMHILEMRRSEPLRRAAEESTAAAHSSAATAKAALITARWATLAAFLSALAAFIALLRN